MEKDPENYLDDLVGYTDPDKWWDMSVGFIS